MKEIQPIREGMTGWPWTRETSSWEDAGEEIGRLPKISIVVPCFNHAAYLEETIRSILLQGYPDLELLVMDGGSTDGTVDILRHYDSAITHWVSEPDSGQSDAINKGLALAKGDILAYINSDDYYLPGALKAIGRLAAGHPEKDIFYGNCLLFRHQLGPWFTRVSCLPSFDELLDPWRYWRRGKMVIQPEVFWRREAMDAVGRFFRNDLHMVMDYEFWLRLRQAGMKSIKAPVTVAAFRLHEDQKSASGEVMDTELCKVILEFLDTGRSTLGKQRKEKLRADLLYVGGFIPYTGKVMHLPKWRRSLMLLSYLIRHPRIFRSDKFRSRFGLKRNTHSTDSAV